MSKTQKPCAIGKIIVRTPVEFEWRVPHLHLAVYAQEEGFFCTNIEISLTAFGATVDKAVKNTASVTLQYLNQHVRTAEGYDALIELVDDHVMDEMWRDYRVADFRLGRSKRDINNTLTETYERIIQELREQRIDELLEQHTENLREQLEKIKSEGRFEVEDLELRSISLDPAA